MLSPDRRKLSAPDFLDAALGSYDGRRLWLCFQEHSQLHAKQKLAQRLLVASDSVDPLNPLRDGQVDGLKSLQATFPITNVHLATRIEQYQHRLVDEPPEG